MSTVHIHQTTTSRPEQFLAALIDFGSGRSKILGNSADEYLKVHQRGPSDDDITEGWGGVWERLHYDWSDPARVVMRPPTRTFGTAGRATSIRHAANGRNDRFDAVVVREGKNLKGRLLGLVLGTIGQFVLEKAFRNTIRAIEARGRQEVIHGVQIST